MKIKKKSEKQISINTKFPESLMNYLDCFAHKHDWSRSKSLRAIINKYFKEHPEESTYE